MIEFCHLYHKAQVASFGFFFNTESIVLSAVKYLINNGWDVCCFPKKLCGRRCIFCSSGFWFALWSLTQHRKALLAFMRNTDLSSNCLWAEVFSRGSGILCAAAIMPAVTNFFNGAVWNRPFGCLIQFLWILLCPDVLRPVVLIILSCSDYSFAQAVHIVEVWRRVDQVKYLRFK